MGNPYELFDKVDKDTEIWLLDAEIRVFINNKKVTLDLNDNLCKKHQGHPYMTLNEIFERVKGMQIYPYITVEISNGNYGTIFQTGNYMESIGKWTVHGITTGEW